MAVHTVAQLIDLLRASRLLDDRQMRRVEAELTPRCQQAVDLARALVREKLTTLYQLEQICLGRGDNLLLGQYALLRRLGEGGMGQVFLARHRRLDRLDALKVVRPDHVADENSLRRFLREARAAARLNHPNIVGIYDANEHDGTHFIAMEYVEGCDLYRLVKGRGPLPVAQACNYVMQAARGLQHAHERGMVHRDVKPHNLLLTSDGSTIKVLDMGLARLRAFEDRRESEGALTKSGAVMGTPDYMAPEQAIDSHDVDIRADVYSLGCTLYFLLTARPPFPDASLTQKLLWHQQKEPEPVEATRPDLPGELVAVIRKLMAKSPGDRYQVPAQVEQALAPFVNLQHAGNEAAGVPGPTLPPAPYQDQLNPEELDFSFAESPFSVAAPPDFGVADAEFTGQPPPSPSQAVTVLYQTPQPQAGGPNQVADAAVDMEADVDEDENQGINWWTVIGVVGFLIAAIVSFWDRIVRWFN
jgi:serine/threonine protein kinase